MSKERSSDTDFESVRSGPQTIHCSERRTAPAELPAALSAADVRALEIPGCAELQRLRRGTQLLRLFEEQVSDHALITLDPRGIVDEWNTGAERILGYPTPDIFGQSYSRLFPIDDAELPMRLLALAATLGRHESDVALLRHDGTIFSARLRLVALREGESHLGSPCSCTTLRGAVTPEPNFAIDFSNPRI